MLVDGSLVTLKRTRKGPIASHCTKVYYVLECSGLYLVKIVEVC